MWAYKRKGFWVGIALFLSLLSKNDMKVAALKASYPNYFMSKAKVVLSPDMDVDRLLLKIKEQYQDKNPTTIDGVKIHFEKAWVHLRKSNTEPIIRVYTEAESQTAADSLAERFTTELETLN